jgi:hypothetical protein
MKIAQLHNGEELYFPDEFDDHQMDAAVTKYIRMQTQSNKEQLQEIKLLRQTIEDGITKIATIMSAPKILERDWNDRPIGVKPKLEG